MKNNLTLCLLFVLFYAPIFAQNGQNIVFDLAKKSKKITLEGMKMGKLGVRGVGSLTSSDLAVELKDPSPFIAFSLSMEGSNIAVELIKIDLQMQINGKWQDWETIEASHDFEQNAKKYVTDMRELDKATTAIRVKIRSKSPDTRLKSFKIRLFAAGNVSTGNVNPTTPEEICSKPAVVSRSVWGGGLGLTDEKIYVGTPTFVTVTHLIIHHGASSNVSSNWAGVVASYFDYHVNSNGWSDIGYNYLVAPDGTLFVGRGGGENVQGAHMCGRNVNTMGVCMIGNYVSEQPTVAAVDKLVKVLAWKASTNGIDPLGTSNLASYGLNLANVCGHQDGCGGPSSTSCPGNMLWAQLPTIRQRIKAEITTCVTTTNDLFTEGSVRIAPNPNNGQFQISAILKEKMEGFPLVLSVYGLDGRAIFEQKIENVGTDFSQSVQLQNAAKGLYLVRLRSGDKAFSEKIEIF
ncbi:MAG: N-acetylmuramoyl-L-alanine amidase [Saprospiraceae bacterium]|nr:N-acetylmuramoyl-L-alanine amidase [Saprospiraceae bacterium]